MKSAKLFKNGSSQAIRLPKEYRFEGSEVLVHKVGNALVILPNDEPWKPLLDSLNEFSDDFLEDRDQPALEQRREDFD